VVTVLVFALETWRAHLALQWRMPFTVPALIFILAGAISVLVAPNRTAGLGLFRAYIIEPIAFALVLIHAVTTWRRAVVVLSGFAIAGVVVGIANSVVVIEALRAHTYDVTQTPPVVIYSTANAVALYVVPLVAVAGALALHARHPERLFGAAFLLLGGPQRLFRRVKRAVVGPEKELPKSMLPKEVDQALRKLGPDGEKVRGTLEREFAKYLDEHKAERESRDPGVVAALLLANIAKPITERAGRRLAQELFNPDRATFQDAVERVRARRGAGKGTDPTDPEAAAARK